MNFNRWIAHAEESLPKLKKAILSGPDSVEFPPSQCIAHLGDPASAVRILDYGCGLGRNLRSMSANWLVTGYDSPPMIARAAKFVPPMPRLTLTSDWEAVSRQRFDAVLATLVFQHMLLTDLRPVLRSLLQMSPRLVIESMGGFELHAERRVLAEVLGAGWHTVMFHAGDRDHWSGIFHSSLAAATTKT